MTPATSGKEDGVRPPNSRTVVLLAPGRSASPSPACQAGSVLPENPFDHDTQLRLHILPHRPVDADIPADGLDEFTRNRPQSLVPKHLDGTVIGLESIVKCHLLLREAEFFASAAGLVELQESPQQAESSKHPRGASEPSKPEPHAQSETMSHAYMGSGIVLGLAKDQPESRSSRSRRSKPVTDSSPNSLTVSLRNVENSMNSAMR